MKTTIAILERLSSRADLPADIIATLKISIETAREEQERHYQKGFADGCLHEKKRFAGLFSRCVAEVTR